MEKTNVNIIVKAIDKFSNTFKNIWEWVDKITNKVKQNEATFKKMAWFWSLAFLWIWAWIKSVVDRASDLVEINQKFWVVYSKMAKEAEASARWLAKYYWLAQSEAKWYLADIWDLVAWLWFTQKASLKFSETVVWLWVDLASFSNVAGWSAEAIDRLKKGLLGEHENLKALWIQINEEMVKTQLLKDWTAELTGVQLMEAKVQARLKLAIEQSKNAIWDFARSKDSLANQSRILQNRIKDLWDNLWVLFYPIVLKITTALVSFTQRLTELAQAHPKLIKTVIALSMAIAGLMVVVWTWWLLIPQFTKSFVFLRVATTQFLWVVKLLLRPLTALLFTKKSLVVETARYTIRIIANTLAKIKNLLFTKKLYIAELRLWRANLFSAKTFKILWKSIFWLIKRVIILWSRFFFIATIVATVVAIIYAKWDWIKQKLAPIFETIARMWQAVPQIIADWWNLLVDVVVESVNFILRSAKKVVQALNKIPWVDIDVSWLDKAMSTVTEFWNWLKIEAKDVSDTFKAVWWVVKDFTNWVVWNMWLAGWSMWDLWTGAWKIAEKVGWLSDETQRYIDKITEKFDETKDAIAETVTKIKDLSKEFVAFKDEAKRSILDVNKQLKDLADQKVNIELNFKQEKEQKLWDRYITVTRDIKTISSKKDKSKEDLEKLKELKKELAILEKELTDEQIKQIENNAKLTETEKILLDLQKRKAEELAKNKAETERLLEKKKILELQANQKSVMDLKIKMEEKNGILKWYYENEKWEMVEVKDYENVLLLEKIAQKQAYFKQETEALTLQLQTQRELQKQNLEIIKDLWKKHHKDLEWEQKEHIQKMVLSYDPLIAKLKKIIALRAKAWMSTWWSTGWVTQTRARWWEVQAWQTYLVWERWPELFTAPSDWTIIPNNNIGWVNVNINMWWVVVQNEADVYSLAETIKETLINELKMNKQFWIA